ncbi:MULTISPECIES: hypothetical protein [unclassified Streptomyces]
MRHEAIPRPDAEVSLFGQPDQASLRNLERIGIAAADVVQIVLV